MNKRLLTLLLLITPMFTFAQEKGLDQRIDEAFQPIADAFLDIIFFPIYQK